MRFIDTLGQVAVDGIFDEDIGYSVSLLNIRPLDGTTNVDHSCHINRVCIYSYRSQMVMMMGSLNSLEFINNAICLN